MALYDYLKSLSDQEVDDLASACGTTTLYLWRLARGMKRGDRQSQPQPKLAALLDLNSNKIVRRWDCRPDDWHIIWPELVGVPGAPQPPVGADLPDAANDSAATRQAA